MGAIDIRREIERNNKLTMWKGIKSDLASVLEKAARAHKRDYRRCEPEYAADIEQYLERFSALMQEHLAPGRKVSCDPTSNDFSGEPK